MTYCAKCGGALDSGFRCFRCGENRAPYRGSTSTTAPREPMTDEQRLAIAREVVAERLAGIHPATRIAMIAALYDSKDDAFSAALFGPAKEATE